MKIDRHKLSWSLVICPLSFVHQHWINNAFRLNFTFFRGGIDLIAASGLASITSSLGIAYTLTCWLIQYLDFGLCKWVKRLPRPNLGLLKLKILIWLMQLFLTIIFRSQLSLERAVKKLPIGPSSPHLLKRRQHLEFWPRHAPGRVLTCKFARSQNF